MCPLMINRRLLFVCVLGVWGTLFSCSQNLLGKEPLGTEKNIEHKVLDSFANLDNWYNTTEETKVSVQAAPSGRKGKTLLFANVVNHKIGTSPKYLIGWPRAGINLKKIKLTDWSQYNFVQFSVYTESSRKKLPKNALSVGFYHGKANAQTSTFPLDQLQLKKWVNIIIPVSKIGSPENVEKMQFNIAEADYADGDQIDFHISPIEILRYTEPVFDSVEFEQSVLYSNSKSLVLRYQLMGPADGKSVTLEATFYDANQKQFGSKRTKATQQGELQIRLPGSLKAGIYSVQLRLKSANRKVLDEKEMSVRVIEGPF